MLKGRFGNTSHIPYIEGYIVFPRFRLRGNVSFIVDTGADNCVIMPADARRFGIDFAKLRHPRHCIGLNGLAKTFEERALVTFADTRSVYTYNVKVDFVSPNPDLEKTPSLLGRDILERWRMVYDPSRKTLSFKVNSADLTSKI